MTRERKEREPTPPHVIPTTRKVPSGVSASQINTYLDCPRKWWWEKVADVVVASDSSSTDGSTMHAMIEAYLEDETPFPVDDPDPHMAHLACCAAAVMPVLPPTPHPKEWIEAYIHDTTTFPLLLRGYIDLIDVTDVGDYIEILVTDHKSKSRIDRRFIPTPEELERDTQAILYSAWARDKFKGAAKPIRIAFQHNNLARNKPKLVPIRTAMTDEAIDRGLDVLKFHVANMVVTAKVDNPRDIDVSNHLSACDKYRGCPHVTRCSLIGDDVSGRGEIALAMLTGLNPQGNKEVNVNDIFAKFNLPKSTESAKPAVAEPAVTQPEVAETAVVEPEVAETAVVEPEVVETVVVEPAVVETVVVEPEVVETVVSFPETAKTTKAPSKKAVLISDIEKLIVDKASKGADVSMFLPFAIISKGSTNVTLAEILENLESLPVPVVSENVEVTPVPVETIAHKPRVFKDKMVGENLWSLLVPAFADVWATSCPSQPHFLAVEFDKGLKAFQFWATEAIRQGKYVLPKESYILSDCRTYPYLIDALIASGTEVL